MSSGDFPGASSRFIPASPVALERGKHPGKRSATSVLDSLTALLSYAPLRWQIRRLADNAARFYLAPSLILSV